MRKPSRRWKRRERRPRLRTFERLEERQLLASDFQNPRNPVDVNADERVSPLDALLVINRLNTDGSGPLSPGLRAEGESPPGLYVDTSGDAMLSPIDVLLVINALAEGEASAGPAAVQVLGFLPGAAAREVTITGLIHESATGIREIGIFTFAANAEDPPSMSPSIQGIASIPSRQMLFQSTDRANSLREVSVIGGQHYGIYIIPQNGSIGNAEEHLRVTPVGDASWNVGWEESQGLWPSASIVGDRGYDDLRLTLTASAVNSPPEFISTPEPEGSIGVPYVYDSEANDPDGDVLSYKLMSGPSGMTVDSLTGAVRWTPGQDDIGSHSVAIQVTDGGGTDLQDYLIEIRKTPSNRPPVITSEPRRIAYLGAGEAIGEPVPVDLRSWSTIQYEFNIFRDAEWVIAEDGKSVRQIHNPDASIFLSDFELTDAKIEGTWLMDGGDDDMVGFVFGYQDTGHFYLLDWKAAPQDRQGTQFLGTAERGMSFRVIDVEDDLQARDVWPTAGNGARSRVTKLNDVPWLHNVEYRFKLEFHPGEITINVSDGKMLNESFTLHDDTYTSGGFGFYNFSQDAAYRGFTTQTVPDSRYVYDVEAMDADGDRLTYELVDAPAGMEIGSNTGLITWSPTEDFLGNNNITVKASDGRGGEAIQEFIVCVHPDANNRAPIIVSTPVTSVPLRSPVADYVYDVEALDADFDTLTYDLVEAPLGMSISPESGIITWQVPRDIDASTTFSISIEVRDNRGGVDEQSFEIELQKSGTGAIRGVKFKDVDADGHRLQIQSEDFSTSSGTWVPDGASLHYQSTGGNPGGYLELRDTVNTRLGLLVDAGIVAHLDAYDGGTLSFDARSVNGIVEPFDVFGSVTIRSSNGDAVLDVIDTVPGSSWSTFTVPLDNVTWGMDAAEWSAILRTASEFEITLEADFRLREHVGFDNFLLTPLTSDPTLQGWTLYVDDNNNGRLDRGERIAITDRNGIFEFSGLRAGHYVVREEHQSGWRQTFPAAGVYEVTLADGQSVDDIDFGNIQAADSSDLGSLFSSVPILEAVTGEKYQYDAKLDLREKRAFQFDLPAAPPGMSIHSEFGTVVWMPTIDQLGSHQVVLRVTDGGGRIALQPFQVTVTEPNEPPVFSSEPPAAAAEGRAFRYDANASDPDGDSDRMTYRLGAGSPVDMLIESTTGIVSWNVPAGTSGNVSANIIATDERGGETTQSLDLQIFSGPNREPTIDSMPRTSAGVGVTWFYAPRASDPDGESITLSLMSGPHGMAFVNGVLQWRPTTTGMVTAVIEAADARGGIAQQTIPIDVGLTLPNSAPKITSTPPRIATFDSLFRYKATATDADNDSVTWDVPDAPTGVVVDQTNGIVRWTPTEEQLGSQEITLVARDAYGGTHTQTFTVEVGCTNANPSIHSIPITNATVDAAYSYQLDASDPENETLEFFALERPNGLAVDATSGLITWTPAAGQEGLNNVRIGVRDAYQNVATQSFQIDVEAALTAEQQAVRANEPPQIASLPVFRVLPNATYEYDLKAVDLEDGELSYEVTGPTGMTIDQRGRIRWAVDRPADSVHDIRVTITDPLGAKAFQSYKLTVAPNSPPTIVSIPSTEVAAGALYSHDLRVFDADGDRINYKVESAAPITIDDRGHIRWQTSLTDGGTVPVTITVTDDHGASDSTSFDLNVLGDLEPPKIETGFATNDVLFGTTQPFQVRATDNVEVASVELTFAGQTQTLVNIGDRLEAMIHYNRAGHHDVQITAIDTSGNVAVETIEFRVTDPNAADAPEVRITSPTDSRVPGSSIFEVSYLQEIRGTVKDDNHDIQQWSLDYTLASNVDLKNQQALTDESEIWTNIATGTNEVDNEVLGTFDPTTISNNNYIIRLLASDSERIRAEGIFVSVVGEAKLGNFRLEFTDLQIPLAGIPIEITRVYDTLQANTSADFGFGWSMGGNDPLILETVPEGGEFVSGQTKVYLTNPEGRRVGFTYVETPKVAGFLGDVVNKIEFRPDAGVYDELSIDQKTITRGGLSGAFGSIAQALGGVLMNPSVYTLTTKDGLKYRYDQFDGLQTISDLNGNVATFTKDGISHSSGVAITFERDADGRIDKINVPITDNDGNPDTAIIDYDYANGGLVKFTDQSGDFTTYTYYSNPAHFLDEALDQNGQREFKVVYRDRRFSNVIDVNGMTIQTAEPPDLLARQAVVRDGNDNPTTLFFDDRGNVLREVDPLGNETIRKYEDSRNPDLETEIIDRRGFVTLRDYDARGNLREIREVGHQDNPFAEPVRTKFTYDTGNRVKSITNARQQTTWFEYDGKGNLKKIVNAKGDFSTFTYDGKGRRESFTDFNGNTTSFAYSSGDQPTRVTFADGTYQEFTYNQYGQVTSEKFFEAGGTLPVEQKATYYDKLGRVTHEFDGETTVGVSNQVRSFYDGDGNLDWQIIVNPASLDANGNLTESPDTPVAQRLSRITDFDYDDRGNLIQQIDAERGVVEFRYDNNGNRVLLQDPVGNITTWVYDVLNRVSEERDPFYNEAFTINQAMADLSQASGASCETNTRAIHVTLSCNDGEGNLAKEIDRNGRRREFDYNSAGRLLTEDWFNTDNSHERALTFTYDVVGNMLTADDPDSSLTFVYDVLNRLESVDNAGTPGTPNVVLTYAYDKQGNFKRTQDNSGVTVESEYDVRNRLAVRKWFDADVPAGETADVDPARVDMLYNAAGRMTEMTRWSDLDKTQFVGKTTRTYDLSGRSDLLTHTDATDDLIASYDYDYNFAGLLDFETREHQDDHFSQTIAYDYDLTGQLTDVDYSKQADEFYRYDANGNRIESYLHGTDYVTDTANQLKSDGDFDYEYDDEGNLILKTKLNTDADGDEGEVTTYEYDHRNRLVNVTRKSAGGVIISEVSYTYDALNRRIARTANGETVHFVYNGDNVWADFNQAGEAVARYLFGDRIDQNIARFRSSEGTVSYLVDRMGSVRDLTDSTGGPVRHEGFSSFGRPLTNANDAIYGRYLFAGRELDELTSNFYFRAREFSPQTGRFNSIDPLGFDAADSNLYRYTRNDSVNAVDPTGELIVELAGIAFTASGFAIAAGGVAGVLPGTAIGIGFLVAAIGIFLIGDASTLQVYYEVLSNALDMGPNEIRRILEDFNSGRRTN